MMYRYQFELNPQDNLVFLQMLGSNAGWIKTELIAAKGDQLVADALVAVLRDDMRITEIVRQGCTCDRP